MAVRPTGTLLGSMRCSRSVRGCAAHNRWETTRQLTKAGCRKIFRDVHVSGAKTNRAQLRRLLDQLEADDVLMVTRLDRLARSTRDLLNVLATFTGKKAGFRSLGDPWADTTASHGRMFTVLARLMHEGSRSAKRKRDCSCFGCSDANRACGISPVAARSVVCIGVGAGVEGKAGGDGASRPDFQVTRRGRRSRSTAKIA
jgi:hypothetical protein